MSSPDRRATCATDWEPGYNDAGRTSPGSAMIGWERLQSRYTMRQILWKTIQQAACLSSLEVTPRLHLMCLKAAKTFSFTLFRTGKDYATQSWRVSLIFTTHMLHWEGLEGMHHSCKEGLSRRAWSPKTLICPCHPPLSPSVCCSRDCYRDKKMVKKPWPLISNLVKKILQRIYKKSKKCSIPWEAETTDNQISNCYPKLTTERELCY